MYAYSFEGEIFSSDDFETLEEALQAAKKDALDWNHKPQTAYIGEIGTFEPTVFADNIIEQLQCDAEELCEDAAEDYLRDCTEKQEDELTEMLTATFHEWEKKYHFEPRFHPIENVQEFEIGE